MQQQGWLRSGEEDAQVMSLVEENQLLRDQRDVALHRLEELAAREMEPPTAVPPVNDFVNSLVAIAERIAQTYLREEADEPVAINPRHRKNSSSLSSVARRLAGPSGGLEPDHPRKQIKDNPDLVARELAKNLRLCFMKLLAVSTFKASQVANLRHRRCVLPDHQYTGGNGHRNVRITFRMITAGPGRPRTTSGC